MQNFKIFFKNLLKVSLINIFFSIIYLIYKLLSNLQQSDIKWNHIFCSCVCSVGFKCVKNRDEQIVVEILQINIDVSIHVNHDCFVKHDQVIISSHSVKFFLDDLITNFQNVHFIFVDSECFVVFYVFFIKFDFNLIQKDSFPNDFSHLRRKISKKEHSVEICVAVWSSFLKIVQNH